MEKFTIEYKSEDSVLLRKCRQCREYKELTVQNFIKRPTENGWRGKCRLCFNVTARSKQELNNTEKEIGKRYRESFKLKNPFKVLLNTARGNAKKTGKEFLLTEDFLKSLFDKQLGKCYYTGRQLNLKLSLPDSISIDRFDSSIGYINTNVVLCQYKINVMKNDLSFKDLIMISKDILKLHSND